MIGRKITALINLHSKFFLYSSMAKYTADEKEMLRSFFTLEIIKLLPQVRVLSEDLSYSRPAVEDFRDGLLRLDDSQIKKLVFLLASRYNDAEDPIRRAAARHDFVVMHQAAFGILGDAIYDDAPYRAHEVKSTIELIKRAARENGSKADNLRVEDFSVEGSEKHTPAASSVGRVHMLLASSPRRLSLDSLPDLLREEVSNQAKRDQEVERLRLALDAQQKQNADQQARHRYELELAEKRGILQGLQRSRPPESGEECPVTLDRLTADAKLYPSGRSVSAAGFAMQVADMEKRQTAERERSVALGKKAEDVNTILCTETMKRYRPEEVTSNFAFAAALTKMNEAQEQWEVQYKTVIQEIADLERRINQLNGGAAAANDHGHSAAAAARPRSPAAR